MNLDRLVRRYADYSRNKWLPQTYADPMGPLIDDINEDTLKRLKDVPGKIAAALALEILALLPRVQHRDLFADVKRAFEQKLDGLILPAAAFYYLRASSPEKRSSLWNAWKEWAMQSETPLHDWLDVRFDIQRNFKDVRSQSLAVFGIDAAEASVSLEGALRVTRDIFDFELRRHGNGRTLAEWLGIFRLQRFETERDWNDFAAFADHWALTCGIPTLPALKRATDHPHVQLAFPIDPPTRVTQLYGAAAGPLDTLSFLQELGRASFYRGFNAELPAAQRLLGDPQLPHFWSFLYGSILLDQAGITRLIRSGMEDLANWLRLALQFRVRYDCVLALYHERVGSEMKEAQDMYSECWDLAFSFEPPRFLYLYDLERSGDAMHRVRAFQAALGAIDRLKSLYGNEWFASSRCAQRLRDYRHEAFGIAQEDLLQDLGAVSSDQFLML